MFKDFFGRLFSNKDSEQLVLEQALKSLTAENVIKVFDVSKMNLENKMTKINEQEQEAISTNEEVVVEDAPQEEVVSEETEVVVQEQEQEPKNESEENEPSEDETVETEEEPAEQVEEVAETEEAVEEEVVEGEEGQEEPQEQEEVVEEELEPETEAEGEEVLEEMEQPEGEPPVQEVKVPSSVNAVAVEGVSVEVKTSDLLKQIDELKAEKAEKELELQKMALSKEVEQDFSGVPGKLEDKVNMVFEIKNSALSEETKNVIFASLKQLSEKNLSDCEEVGHDQEVEIDEKAERESKIQNAMKEHGLTANQAFLYVNGDRTLAEAKKASAKVQAKRK